MVIDWSTNWFSQESQNVCFIVDLVRDTRLNYCRNHTTRHMLNIRMMPVGWDAVYWWRLMGQYTLMAMCLGRHGDSTSSKHVHCPEKMHRLGINRKETLGATGWPRRPENGHLNSVSACIWGRVKDHRQRIPRFVIRRYLEKSIQKKLFCHLQSLQIKTIIISKYQISKYDDDYKIKTIINSISKNLLSQFIYGRDVIGANW